MGPSSLPNPVKETFRRALDIFFFFYEFSFFQARYTLYKVCKDDLTNYHTTALTTKETDCWVGFYFNQQLTFPSDVLSVR